LDRVFENPGINITKSNNFSSILFHDFTDMSATLAVESNYTDSDSIVGSPYPASGGSTGSQDCCCGRAQEFSPRHTHFVFLLTN
jgi:hypothetical protein